MLPEIKRFGESIGLIEIDRNLCIVCGEQFSERNVHSAAGWREILISGICEDCFDGLFEDEE